MGHFLCCWKCTKDQNDTTIDEEGFSEEYEEEAEENPKWLAFIHVESEKEHSKLAIAVVVADAAVAAAYSAVAVVRLTSKQSDWHERYWAAVKIQSAFRAYLARKALQELTKFNSLIRFQEGQQISSKNNSLKTINTDTYSSRPFSSPRRR